MQGAAKTRRLKMNRVMRVVKGGGRERAPWAVRGEGRLMGRRMTGPCGWCGWCSGKDVVSADDEDVSGEVLFGVGTGWWGEGAEGWMWVSQTEYVRETRRRKDRVREAMIRRKETWGAGGEGEVARGSGRSTVFSIVVDKADGGKRSSLDSVIG